ncbi:hypothetical protein Klosneuvirus_1_388 [Klosneuvirus KNV1]|uniref:Uncharacterized protein n=1 Tax=Klosneuvirus KNV1 TaxID=1977640 RepID=A0A1V0SIP8_9VIRU|nr:hypothetical protein Klosneuvirus_1_388 [Klosneuvirus KNV1]
MADDTTSNNSYSKQYYIENKDQWNIKKICEICGGEYSRNTRSRHFKTSKHLLAEKDSKIKEQDKIINDLETKITTIKRII